MFPFPPLASSSLSVNPKALTLNTKRELMPNFLAVSTSFGIIGMASSMVLMTLTFIEVSVPSSETVH